MVSSCAGGPVPASLEAITLQLIAVPGLNPLRTRLIEPLLLTV